MIIENYNQSKAEAIDGVLKKESVEEQGSFYWHLATYLTARVRQLTDMVGNSLASRGSDLTLEEVYVRQQQAMQTEVGSMQTDDVPGCAARGPRAGPRTG